MKNFVGTDLLLCYFFLVTCEYIKNCNGYIMYQKIDHQESSELISSKTQYEPEGWTAILDCDAFDETQNYYFEKKKNREKIEPDPKISWIRIDHDGISNSNNNDTGFVIGRSKLKPTSIYIDQISEAQHHRTTFECTVELKNATFKSRINLVTQKCEEPSTTGVDYDNPCRFGKCENVRGTVECQCFKQYTGRSCDTLKVYAFLYDFTNFLFIITGLLILTIYYIFKVSSIKSHKWKLLNSAVHFWPVDRIKMTTEMLYPHEKEYRRIKHMKSAEEKSYLAATDKNTECITTTKVDVTQKVVSTKKFVADKETSETQREKKRIIVTPSARSPKQEVEKNPLRLAKMTKKAKSPKVDDKPLLPPVIKSSEANLTFMEAKTPFSKTRTESESETQKGVEKSKKGKESKKSKKGKESKKSKKVEKEKKVEKDKEKETVVKLVVKGDKDKPKSSVNPSLDEMSIHPSQMNTDISFVD